MNKLGINIAQNIPAGKARIYKECSKSIPLVGNYSSQYIDLTPGTYNYVTLQLKGLKDLVYGVSAGTNVRVELYKESNFSDSPYIVVGGSHESFCLPELWKGRARGIKIIATEGFTSLGGINMFQILFVIALLIIICFLYFKSKQNNII